MTPNNTPEPGQFPAPVTPPPPPKGLVHLILSHRFFVVALVVVLFLGTLFALGSRHGGSTLPKPEGPLVTATHGEPAATAPKELELRPLIPPPPKGAHEAGAPATPAPLVTHEPTPATPKAGSSHAPPAIPAVATPPREPAKGEVFTQA
jgi:hypothetical protein